jgi:SAM-dependent MidA family methyltransferase
MGSSATSSPAAGVPPTFAAIFREAAGAAGALTFAHFMEIALYHPVVGYYRRQGPRVGYGRGTDFFTASTSGPVFGELVVAACLGLLGPQDPHDHTFVEIGAESSAGILAGVTHPFGSARIIGVADTLELSGRCIVFSNELFDAQPFHRYIFRGGAWRELGVRLQGDALVEVEMASSTPAPLPVAAQENQIFDAPVAATQLVSRIAAQPWQGLFVACDYGRSFQELAENHPSGTARAYHRHTQSNDLLARPGEQDLTCHVCWDWLSESLSRHEFREVTLESQESFFVHHAADYLGRVTTAEAGGFSAKKLSLLQLLHPSNLGQKFQVLHGRRE